MYIRQQQKPVEGFTKVLSYFIAFIIAVFILLVAVVYFFSNTVAFNTGKSPAFHFPNDSFKEVFMPDELGMSYQNMTIPSPVDSKNTTFDELYGWFVYQDNVAASVPTIVYFHENDYYPPARLYMIEKLYKNPQKYNVIMVDYRGYGYSSGNPTEDGLYSDCRAIMDHVLAMPNIDQDQVYIFGASLGGAMATYSALLYQDRVQGLILQNTIENAYKTAVFHAPYLAPVFKLGLKVDLPSIDRIPDINLPMMFIVGLNDTSTGPHQMYDLYDAAALAPSKTLYKIPNCEHYLTWYYGGKEFDDQLTSFINSARLSKTEAPTKTQEYYKRGQKIANKASETFSSLLNSVFE